MARKVALNNNLKYETLIPLRTSLLILLSHKFLTRFKSILRLSYYDYLSKHPYPILSQVWNLAPLLLLYLSTFLFFNHFLENSNREYASILALGLCCWNFFRESTGQASSIYAQKWKLIKNTPLNSFKLHAALTLSSFYSLLIHLGVFLSGVFLLTPSSLSFSLEKLFLGLLGILIITYLINLILAPLCAIYKDGFQLWGIFLQVFIWANPIFIPINTFPSIYKKILIFNPLGNFLLLVYQSLGLQTQINFQYESLLTLLFLGALALYVSKNGKKNVILSI